MRSVPWSSSSSGASKSKTHCGEESACHRNSSRTPGTVSRQSSSPARTDARQSLLPPRLASFSCSAAWWAGGGDGGGPGARCCVSSTPRRGSRSSSPLLLGLPITMS